MSKDASRNFSSVTTQQQVILRLPEDLAERIRKLISDGQQADKSGALVIDIQPQESQASDKYIFNFQNERYNALLANLPTNVETHKTFDKKIFIKTGDVGQILIVFKTERERDLAYSRTCKTLNGDYYPSGLTPPTVDIVRRKFELTRKAEQYPTHSVRAILDELKRPWTPITEAQSLKVLAPAEDGNPEEERGKDREVCEVVYEEVVAFEDWMVSREQPEGVSAVIMGREWTSPRTGSGAGSTGSTGAVSSQLIQDHPELLVTEVDLEEDRDREDYISVMKAQKAKDEAVNADSVIGSAATTSNTTSATNTATNTTSNTTSVASKDKASASATATAREKDWTATSTSTSTSVDSRSVSAAAEHQSTDRMSNSSNAQQHNKTSPSEFQRQMGEEKEERGRDGGEESDASKLKITLTLPPKTENSSSQSSETRERTFSGNVLLSSGASHNDDQNDILQLQIKEEIKDEGEVPMEIVNDSSIPISTLSLSSTPLVTSQSQSQSQYTESKSAASAVLQVEIKDEVNDGVTDEAEALRKAFEDASDSDDDDDDEDDGGGGGGDVGKGSAGGDVVAMGGNIDDEEEEEEEEEGGDEVEEVLEEGGRAVIMEGQGEGVQRSVEKCDSEEKAIDMNTSAPGTVTETEAGVGVEDGEMEANEDDDDDEEDWMKDV